MAESSVVFITGINKGIGKRIAEKYLLRPQHVFIGSVRDKTSSAAQKLKRLPVAEGSSLLLVSIESTSATDPQKAFKEIEAAGISHLDVVIANAGISPTHRPLDVVHVEDVVNAFQINAVGPIRLYQAVEPLLEKSPSPKWVSVSTAASFITNLHVHNASLVGAYGVSKATQNWLTAAVNSANQTITAFAIHPGLVQTEMGNEGARMMGMEQAPTTIEESASKTIKFIDAVTKEQTSGKFINVIDQGEIPW